MKTSNKILIAIAGIALALLFTGLVLFRGDMQAMLSETGMEYQTIQVAEFNALDISGSWNVRVKQGRDYKVELQIRADSLFEPAIENRNGTLFFEVDSSISSLYSEPVYARVTVPALEKIKAVNGAQIRIDNYAADSLYIELRQGTLFSGKNNRFRFVSYDVSGDAKVNLTDTDG